MLRAPFALLFATALLTPGAMATADIVEKNPLSAEVRAEMSARAASERAAWTGGQVHHDSSPEVNKRDLAIALIAVGWRKTFR